MPEPVDHRARSLELIGRAEEMFHAIRCQVDELYDMLELEETNLNELRKHIQKGREDATDKNGTKL